MIVYQITSNQYNLINRIHNDLSTNMEIQSCVLQNGNILL